MKRRAHLLLAMALVACGRRRDERPKPAPRTLPSAPIAVAIETPPKVLYLGDAGAPLPQASALPTRILIAPNRRCPPEMVDVLGRFCIDRYEATLVDAKSGNELSPFYYPKADIARHEYEYWQKARLDATTPEGRLLDVPAPPEWELGASTLSSRSRRRARARSRAAT